MKTKTNSEILHRSNASHEKLIVKQLLFSFQVFLKKIHTAIILVANKRTTTTITELDWFVFVQNKSNVFHMYFQFYLTNRLFQHISRLFNYTVLFHWDEWILVCHRKMFVWIEHAMKCMKLWYILWGVSPVRELPTDGNAMKL